LEYRIVYKKSITKDLKGIDKTRLKKIIDGIEKKLKQNPRAGKMLTGEFKGLYRIRIGDYRAIYSILESDVLMLRIAHRKDVYK
jgi:mRNA interferase RelE/StbE